MRATVPPMLARRLSPTQVSLVTKWWRGLTPAEHRALRRDPGRPPAGVVGRFVVPDSRGEDAGEPIDFYEYLVNHEIFLEDGRPYHICSAHPEARAAIAAGRIPAAFRCPRADVDCPMRALLSTTPGCDLRLSLARAPKSGSTPHRERHP